jgi:hypothetical protein
MTYMGTRLSGVMASLSIGVARTYAPANWLDLAMIIYRAGLGRPSD